MRHIVLGILLFFFTFTLNAQRLTLGGYGEAAYTRNFFRDNVPDLSSMQKTLHTDASTSRML